MCTDCVILKAKALKYLYVYIRIYYQLRYSGSEWYLFLKKNWSCISHSTAVVGEQVIKLWQDRWGKEEVMQGRMRQDQSWNWNETQGEKKSQSLGAKFKIELSQVWVSTLDRAQQANNLVWSISGHNMNSYYRYIDIYSAKADSFCRLCSLLENFS